MDSQTVIVLVLIIAATLYVGRAFWPARKSKAGCSMCPQNRRRKDDYI